MMTVYVLNAHSAVRLAAEELQRCLTEMAGDQMRVETTNELTDEPGIWLGTPDTLGDRVRLPAVRSPDWDDAFCVRSVDESLLIGGVNPRSVLMGAYEYLRQLGAEWLWPGEDGEVLPKLDHVPLAGFNLVRVPPNRHRGVCIEGAPALEHALEMVEWMPKVGYNSYFLQFQVSSYFWRLWYEHSLNPEWHETMELTEEECADLDRQVTDEVKRRGLLLHQVGHGWTAAALDLPTNGWVTYDGELREEDRRLLAQVNGKRDLWQNGIAINTELCYSNPDTRRRLVDTVIEYAREHPEVDALHFWLSDAPNNHCECPDCAELTPADWYVTLVNEISPRLKEVAPDMKLVLLVYHDLLWPPEEVTLDLSHDNLVAMFAPISRCYAHSMADPACDSSDDLVRPALNEMQMPRDNHSLVELWANWRWQDPANSFCFDYHFMWPWMGDRISLHLARLMPEDVADYASLNLGGLMNCGAQRIFYPTGWPYHLTARLLCGEAVAESDRERYFDLAYGEGGRAAMDFLDGLARASGGPAHGPDWWQQVRSGHLGEVRSVLDEFADEIAALAQRAQLERHARSWRLLQHYHELVSRYAAAQEHKEVGRPDEAIAQIEAIEDFLRTTEPQTARALDTYTLLKYLDRLKSQWG